MRKWLIELRKSKGYTQIVLADKLAITQSYLSGIETGEKLNDLNLSLMSKLSDVFNMSLDEIRQLEEGETYDGKH